MTLRAWWRILDRHWRDLPILLRFLAQNAMIGSVLGVVFAGVLVWSSCGKLLELIVECSDPLVPTVMLTIGFATLIGGLYTGSAIMLLPYEDEPSGHRPRFSLATDACASPIPVAVVAGTSRTSRNHIDLTLSKPSSVAPVIHWPIPWVCNLKETNMHRALRLTAAVLFLAGASLAMAQSYTKGEIVIKHPWTRATPQGAEVGAGYVTVTNKGKEADTLTGATFDGAERVEIHEMKMDGDKMQMRALPDGLPVKPGETIALSPGGNHLMLMGLKKALAASTAYKGTLVFAKAGSVDVEFKTEAIGATESHDH